MITNVYTAARIALAIEKASGIKYRVWTQKSRKIEYVYCRMVFCLISKQYGMKEAEIFHYLNINRATVYTSLKTAKNELKTNKAFRKLYEMTKERLNSIQNHKTVYKCEKYT